MSSRLFPIDAPELTWTEFAAEGFPAPVAGVVYRPGQSACGLPLGGIGTGCIDLDTDGTFGRCTIFNSYVPPRELGAIPFLRVNAEGKTWALTTRPVPDAAPAKRIHYWGHYPVADLEYELDSAPVSVGLRAWSPFIPGDAIASNTPGGVFEVHVRNSGNRHCRGTVEFTPPMPAKDEFAAGASYAVRVLEDAAIEARSEHSAAARFDLGGSEDVIIRFVLGWHCPITAGSAYHQYVHAYASRFPNARAVVDHLAAGHGRLLERILTWQQAIYGATEHPTWLRDCLVNNFHLLAEDAFWAANSIPLEQWCVPEGMFTMVESTRTCPGQSCIPSDWYGNLPVVFFFPELARSTLRGFAHYQTANGEIPIYWGIGLERTMPVYHLLHVTNNACYIDLVDRLWQCTASDDVLREFYPSVKAAFEYMKTLDKDADGLIDCDVGPGGNQFYGEWLWYGAATHLVGLWLACLKMVERMASRMRDAAAVQDCRVWFQLGRRSLEEKLWRGQSYLLFNETATGRQSDTILANQLAGEWCGYAHGTPGVFPAERVKTVLQTVKRLAVPATPFGAVNAIRPDGSMDKTGALHSAGIFCAENLCLAMTLLYTGDAETGKEIARRTMENIVLRQGLGWDMPNIVDPKTGQMTHGHDFDQMMMLWAVPAALERKDLASFTAPGGWVDRIIDAGRERTKWTMTA